MSDRTQAVFLSYASQDADAARRVAEALRAAGVEVWFDQSELRGGDSWDRKIRDQIKTCALFVPIISAHTQERSEGYFRLEWHLAEQRTYLMAHDTPFLFPVVIDATTDAEARVPEKFRERQWMRLDGRDTPESLARRIVTVLAGESSASSPRAAAPSLQTRAAAPRARSGVPAWAWMLGGIGIAAIVVFAVLRSRLPAEPAAARSAHTNATRPATEADKLVERASAILDGSALSREQIDAANGLLEQAIEVEPSNAAAWTAAARADLMLIHPYGYDRSEERRQRAMSRATRALNLAPDSFETRVVQTAVMAHASGNPALTKEAEDTFRRMIEERPDDNSLKVRLAEVLREQQRFDEAATLFEKIGAFEVAGWSWSSAGNLAAAYEQVKRAVTEKPTTTALMLKSNIETNWFENLTLAQATINQLRPSELQSEIAGASATRLAFWLRDPERMLQLLNGLSHDFLDSHAFVGPRQYYTGWAHRLAGRNERANIEWRKAVAVLEAERVTAPDRVRLFELEAEVRALLGETAEAERLLAHAQRIASEAPGTVSEDNCDAYLALGRKEPVLAWLRSTLLDDRFRRVERLHAEVRFSPIWDGLRGDPRFEKLLRETLPPEAKPFDDPKPAVAEAVPEKSVAVLAFANLSDDKDNEYFSDGISEELLNVLAKVPGLKVTARTSSFHFKGKDTSIPEIAQQLGVAYVIEGSVRKQGDRVRITAQLIKAADGFHVWSDTFTRDLKDIFAVQDEIAGLIADQMQLKLGVTQPARVVDPEAYRLLLEARFFWNQRGEQNFDRAEALLKQALAIDPDFAPAQAAMADVWVLRAAYRVSEGKSDVSAELRALQASVSRALELDPARVEPYTAKAYGLLIEGKFDESGQWFDEALTLRPDDPTVRMWHAMYQRSRGDFRAAAADFASARRLDPLSFIIAELYGDCAGDLGLTGEALELLQRSDELRIGGFIPAQGNQAVLLWQMGRTDEAITLARTVRQSWPAGPRWQADAGALWVLGQAGLNEEITVYLDLLLRELPAESYQRGFILTVVNRFDEALPYLAHLSSINTHNLAADPYFDPWRNDPRFRELLRQLNWEEEYDRARAQMPRAATEP